MILSETPTRNELFIESAYLVQLRNDVRVPGSGSNINYRSLIGSAPGISLRLMALGAINSDSGWRAVVAPLSISGTGRFDSTKQFNGVTFAGGVDTRGNYRFDSYRLTYWRRAKGDSRSEWRFGWTLKVRDAEVGLSQTGASTRFKNTGFVPLVHFGGTRNLSERIDLLVDFDGLVAPQGSALDLGLFWRYRLNENRGVFAGFRMLYGGADNDTTFNIATFGYLTAGISVRF